MTNPTAPGQALARHELSTGHLFLLGRVPDELNLAGGEAFERLWALHPADFAEVTIVGRTVPTPRWQQAFGRDYRFSGGHSVSAEVPPLLAPFLAWARQEVDGRLNGLFVNWYDGSRGHYIGPHHDEARDLAPGSPIVTISQGEERVFRFTLPAGNGTAGPGPRRRDVPVPPGSVLVIPADTNAVWKHSVPRLARFAGRRVSVTVRAFV